MDTLTFTHQGQTFNVPVVVTFGPNGQPVDLIGDLEPTDCDHAGQVWSDCLAMRCTRCGAQLFMPGRFLAKRPAEVIEAMYAAWVRAGWPSFVGGHWPTGARWTIVAHPLFEHLGGLAVQDAAQGVKYGQERERATP